MQRATFAKAVLVISGSDGRILMLRCTSGVRLPVQQLDGWRPITEQVEEWLEQLSRQKSTPSLVAFDGTPGREGVTFLFAARLGYPSPESEGTFWLEPAVAAAELDANGKRLLGLCANPPRSTD
jgi:hypothetical protein